MSDAKIDNDKADIVARVAIADITTSCVDVVADILPYID
jgi:hypothetical protein